MWRWRRRTDEDFSEEIQANIALDTDRFIAEGMTPEEARTAAVRAFGNVTRARERFYESRRVMWLDDLRRDIRYACRTLYKNPGFTAVAVLTLALGIGATTAIFSVVYGVLLKPLPFDEPDRLIAVHHLAPGFNTATLPQSAATYFTYRDHARVFEDIGLWRAQEVSITRSGMPEPEQALRVTDGTALPAESAAVARRPPSRTEDDVPGAPNRVLLTYGYWQRAFGASRDVVGQSLMIDGRPYEVVGVLPGLVQVPEHQCCRALAAATRSDASLRDGRVRARAAWRGSSRVSRWQRRTTTSPA